MPVRIVAKTARGQIRNTSAKPSGISKDEFTVAFGASPMNLDVGNDRSPLALLQLREQVAQRLRSTGGRPALLGAVRKMKIPVTEQDRHSVEMIARKVEAGRFKPSAAQVASMILHMALERLPEHTIRDNIEKKKLGMTDQAT